MLHLILRSIEKFVNKLYGDIKEYHEINNMEGKGYKTVQIICKFLFTFACSAHTQVISS